jgi:hypothetical protein
MAAVAAKAITAKLTIIRGFIFYIAGVLCPILFRKKARPTMIIFWPQKITGQIILLCPDTICPVSADLWRKIDSRPTFRPFNLFLLTS